MAWIDPVMDRTGGEYMTADDCNRITGNIKYLDSNAVVPSDVTDNDILTTWLSVVETAIQTMCLNLGLPGNGMTTAWTYDNINKIESLIQSCYDRVGLLRKQNLLTVYSGELYSGQDDYYVGGY